jgi:NitT/TauT family transport system substrate-binding protein
MPLRLGSVLDLGCGTGLGGAAFRPSCDWLVGVDISPGMIEQARAKGLYDRLVVSDLLEFLAAEAGAPHHLTLAADVFVYCSDLAPIATAVAKVLAPSGLFAFTVETHDDPNVRLQGTLRYAHSPSHVRNAITAAGLELRQLTAASTRNEKGTARIGSVGGSLDAAIFAVQSQARGGEAIMKNTKRALGAVALAALFVTGASAQDKVRIAVGGKSAVFYLPLSVAERLGAFKDAGLDVEISDVASGGRTLQAIVGGSAEIGIGTFDHAIQMQAKNQPVVALLQYGRYPGFVLAMMTWQGRSLQSAERPEGTEDRCDLAGLQHAFHGGLHDGACRAQAGRRLVHRHRHHLDGRRGGAACRDRRHRQFRPDDDDDGNREAGEDRSRPRTADGTKAVYGGPYPGGVIYATPAYIEKNPQTVQKVVTAFTNALKWIASHSAEDIAKLMPEEYALGNLPLYIKALSVSKPMYSPDGHFEPGAVGTAYAVLRVFDPAVAGASFDLTKTYNDSFVKKAISGR